MCYYALDTYIHIHIFVIVLIFYLFEMYKNKNLKWYTVY